MLSLNSLPNEDTHFSHSAALLWSTPYGFDDSPCSPSPLSPSSCYFGLSPSFCDDSGLSSPSSPLSPAHGLLSAVPFCGSFTTSPRQSSTPYMLAHPGAGDVSMSAGPPKANILTSITAAQGVLSPAPSSTQKKSSEPLELFEKRSIVPFINKLSGMVRDSSSAGLIFWSRDGQCLVVLDESSIVTCIEKHYRQRNFISFVRQLHSHGFTKKSVSMNVVGLGRDGNSNPGEQAGQCITFTHPSFRRDREDLLHLIFKKKSIRRRIAVVDDHTQSTYANTQKLRTEGKDLNSNILISDLYAQARQLFVQHEQLTCSQNSILLRLQGMMQDLDQHSSAGEGAAARTDSGQPSALKRRKRNIGSIEGTV